MGHGTSPEQPCLGIIPGPRRGNRPAPGAISSHKPLAAGALKIPRNSRGGGLLKIQPSNSSQQPGMLKTPLKHNRAPGPPRDSVSSNNSLQRAVGMPSSPGPGALRAGRPREDSASSSQQPGMLKIPRNSRQAVGLPKIPRNSRRVAGGLRVDNNSQ